MYSPEDNALISAYRQKAAEGTLTPEELTHAVKLLRQARMGAVQSAAKKRSAAVKQTRSADDLLSELEGIVDARGEGL
jgi:hypothetical protein